MREPGEIASNCVGNRYDSIRVISGLCCFSSVLLFIRAAFPPTCTSPPSPCLCGTHAVGGLNPSSSLAWELNCISDGGLSYLTQNVPETLSGVPRLGIRLLVASFGWP
jgi:hypothetical protein